MTITNISIPASSCGHYNVTATVNGVQMTVMFLAAELTWEPEEPRNAFIDRVRSWAKENNYTTMAQVRANIGSQTFKL